MTDDLHTLAAEAIRELRGRYGPLGDGSLRSGCAGELADAVLAAVLPTHRRQALAEAADVLLAMDPVDAALAGFSRLEDGDKAMEWALRAYRVGQAAAPDGPRTWGGRDG